MARIVVEIPGERAYDVLVSAGQIDRFVAEIGESSGDLLVGIVCGHL